MASSSRNAHHNTQGLRSPGYRASLRSSKGHDFSFDASGRQCKTEDTLVPHQPARIEIRGVSASEAGETVLSASIRIGADRRRIHQALTMAEYREAWMTFPSPATDSIHVRAFDCGPGFRLELWSGRRQSDVILGQYLSNRRAKLCFTWNRNSSGQTKTSRVDIRLRGDFNSTVLALNHWGIYGPGEELYLMTFWRDSLEKLSGLLT